MITNGRHTQNGSNTNGSNGYYDDSQSQQTDNGQAGNGNGTAIQAFFNDEMGIHLRITTRDGDEWFVARDVCDALGLDNVTNALRALDDDEIRQADANFTNSDVRHGGRAMLLISESGLYTLIMRSTKPDAKRFRKWVTAEVLPALRKTGRYEAPGAPPHAGKPKALSINPVRIIGDYARMKPAQQRAARPGFAAMLDACGLDGAACLPEPAATAPPVREVGGVPVRAMDVALALREHQRKTGDPYLTTPGLATALGMPGDVGTLRSLGMCVAAYLDMPLRMDDGSMQHICKRRRCASTPQGTRDDVLYWLSVV